MQSFALTLFAAFIVTLNYWIWFGGDKSFGNKNRGGRFQRKIKSLYNQCGSITKILQLKIVFFH